ncbi:hypothetical protein CIRMBP1230_01052 [Enterococcus cecorum]|nr:hypothetical protein [Enterococcus cecorum]CAI3296797.1 hypothetical protein CIRMBP1281_00631 [Enterococcus cecorum]CAI3297970.1 hypothetical protein CIRMBP1228_00624 [Enterococcus cecorum]CAI3310041.1 hypothetical protein CIRMBP1252_00782 [Enterococcus cecorum]CAI3319827.1 hypothetical protein CIRMBP1224_00863 [Enterococcus cecorum]CAI3331046.1 hypothetical protein CIRMBP1208_00789 [Enterococcus cecorum]
MKKRDINIMYLSVGFAGIASVAILSTSIIYLIYQLIVWLIG